MTIKKVIQIDVEADQANKEVEKLDKNLKQTDDTLNSLTGSLDGMTGGAISGFKKVTSSVQSAVTGFKSLKIAIAATGIGLLVIAIGALYTAFKSSEEGQNQFTKLMGQIGVVTGNVIDIIADLGEAIFAVGKILLKVATGDLYGAALAWEEFKVNVKEATDAVINFGKETKKELEIARNIADMRAKATKLQRDLTVETAKAERTVADLREKVARKDLYNGEQRKAMLMEAQAINNSIAAKQIEAARLNYQAIKQENELSKSTIEAKQAEADAQAELIRLDTARLMANKEMSAQISEINNAEKADREQLAADQQKSLDDNAAAMLKQMDDEITAFQELQDTKIEILDLSNEKALEAEKKFAEERKQIEFDVQQAKYSIASTTFTLIEGLAKEGSALAKSAGVAQTLINTYAGIMGAFNTPTPTPYFVKLAQAAAIGVAGALNVKRILSTDGNSSGSGNISTGSRSSAPSFNLVKGTGTNQIANSLSKQEPIKAYVVSSDVTTGQSLDRKIITGASLG